MELKMILNKKIDLSICDLTEKQIDKFSRSKYWHNRFMIAHRLDLSLEQVERLRKDEDEYVRQAIVKIHGVKVAIK